MCAELSEEFVQTPRTMAEQVYDLLRKRILGQELMPGERLLEIAVSESLKVSRTPVRESFRLLQQDGLVERIPQGGVRVTDLSLEELKEISALRAVLEIHAVDVACDRIAEEEIEKLESIVSLAEAMVIAESSGKKIDLAELSRLNTIFHDIICTAARSTYLNKILEIVRLPILRFRPFSLEDKEHRLRGVKEHKKMIEMLKRKDKEGSEEINGKTCKRCFRSSGQNPCF